MAVEPSASLDEQDVARFDKLGRDWWREGGPMAPLHKLNPVRVRYIRDLACDYLTLTDGSERKALQPLPLRGLKILDIGCGGGLLSEPLSRLGAQMTSIDPGQTNIDIARWHATESGLTIDYRNTTAEALAEEGMQFDIVMAMEVIEHVQHPQNFIGTCTSMLHPGGLFFGATLNRTLKSFALAIVGAEYILRWLTPGTHQWQQFVTPEEFSRFLRHKGLKILDRTGVHLDLLSGQWVTGQNLDVNYMLLAQKPK